jgi:hypothetical protein
MRINKFFAAALAATAVLASCSKEAPGNVGNGEVKKAAIRFTLKGSAMTRALSGTELDDTKLGVGINDVTIFVIGNSDAVISREFFTLSDLEGRVGNTKGTTPEITTTTDAKYIIAVGNTGGTTINSKLSAATTLNDLKKIVFTLNEAVVLTPGGGAETSDYQRIMVHGQSDNFAFTGTTTDGDPLANASVTLYPIPARLNVTVLNRMKDTGTTAGWADGYVKIEKVAVLYSANNTFAVPTVSTDEDDRDDHTQYSYVVPQTGITYTPVNYYVSGFDPTETTTPTMEGDDWEQLMNGTDAMNVVATGAPLTYLSRTYTTSGPGTPLTSTNYIAGNDFQGTFYALPGNAYGKEPIIAIVGQYDADGAAGTGLPQRWYWTIKMSSTDAGQLLLNGRMYNVKLTLNGDMKSGGGGNEDPEKEIIKSFVEVEVTAGGWATIIDLDKTIGNE